jgi:hypothetical protein
VDLPARLLPRYEAFFIPDGAKSMADVRDIAERLKSVDEAKAVAERDYAEGDKNSGPVSG